MLCRCLTALLLLIPAAATAWPLTASARVLTAALETDADRSAVVLRFAGEPRVTTIADERARTLLVDFAPAHLTDGARLFRPGEIIEAAGLEPVRSDTLRLVVRVRRGTVLTVLRSPVAAGTFTCAVVAVGEMGDLGPAGAALTFPVRGRVSSHFGMRLHPILHETRMHKGVDIAVPHGTPIRAMRAGTVHFAGWNGASGLCVVVAHEDSVETSYKHCSKLRVTRGERVKRHQILGEAGSTGMSTGSHLHFTVSKDGRDVDPERLMKNKR